MATFNGLDTDGNGGLSPAEITAYLESVDLGHLDVQAICDYYNWDADSTHLSNWEAA